MLLLTAILVGFPRPGSAILEAGLDAGIEEDEIGGPLAGVRNQRCIAALDDPVRVSGIE